MFKDSIYRTAQTASMVMILLVASNFLGSVFSALGHAYLHRPDARRLGHATRRRSSSRSSLLCFILGWPLEWVPIVVIIVPIFLPILEALKVDMVWFCILLAVTLQTCWLSPPVALSAYYLKGVMPKWELKDIYMGMLPFMGLQWVAVLILYFFPADRARAANIIFRHEVGRNHNHYPGGEKPWNAGNS